MWLSFLISIGIIVTAGGEGGRGYTLQASSIVDAWRGLAWTNVWVIIGSRGHQSSIHAIAAKLISLASKTNIKCRIVTTLSCKDMAITEREIANVALLSDGGNELGFLDELLKNYDLPAFSIMMIKAKRNSEKWIELEKHLQKMQLSRGFYSLDEVDQMPKLFRIVTVLNQEIIVQTEMVMDKETGLYLQNYDLQGLPQNVLIVFLKIRNKSF